MKKILNSSEIMTKKKSMSLRGGASNQSGIFYQNSIAALYLGGLLDSSPKTYDKRVIEVRVEAPEHVDDIVITFENSARTFIQAKEKLVTSGKTWENLWYDFVNQWKLFTPESNDRLILYIGSNTEKDHNLEEAFRRIKGSANLKEWSSSHTKKTAVLIKGIQSCISEIVPDSQEFFHFCTNISVNIQTLNQIEENVNFRIPESNKEKITVFSLLRDKCGAYARLKKRFLASELLEELSTLHKVYITEYNGTGIFDYRKAINDMYSIIEVPGTHVSGDITKLFLWPNFQEINLDKSNQKNFELEYNPYTQIDRGDIDLKGFPFPSMKRVFVIAGAGFGKTTFLHAMCNRLSKSNWLPVFIPLIQLVEKGKTIIQFLDDKINEDFSVKINWSTYCTKGQVILLLDGLDELNSYERNNALDLLKKYSSRFPETPWILSARDERAISGGIRAKYLKIVPFNESQIESFARAYSEYNSLININDLIHQLRTYHDLKKLAEIPLFLALLLVTAKHDEVLPRSRSDLLEKYLFILFHPESSNKTQKFIYDPVSLQEKIEHFSYSLLETGKINFTEQDFKDFLFKINDNSSFIDLLTDLKGCGLFNYSINKLNPAFPIIHEYLGAKYLVKIKTVDIIEKFEFNVSQPWAQMILFALEIHSRPDEIIEEILKKEDDAFNTKLRMIGHCIVNGASVSEKVMNQISELLAGIWIEATWKHQEFIGNLLADGFIKFIPKKVLSLLKEGWGFSSGGDKILERLNEPKLIEEVFDYLLSIDFAREVSWYPLKNVIKNNSPVFLEKLINKLNHEELSEKEIDEIGELITMLDFYKLPSIQYKDLIIKNKYPKIVQLAGYLIAPKPISQDALEIATNFLRKDEDTLEKLFHHKWLAEQVIWKVEDPIEFWIELVLDQSISITIRDQILNLQKSDLNKNKKISYYKKLITISELDETLKISTWIWLAYFGDQNALDYVYDNLQNFNDPYLEYAIMSLVNFLSIDKIINIIKKIEKLSLSINQKKYMSNSLCTVLAYKITDYNRSWFGLYRKQLHPASSLAADLIMKWYREGYLDEIGQLIFLTNAVILSPELVKDELKEIIEDFISRSYLFSNSEFDHKYSRALDELNDFDNQNYLLTLDNLSKIMLLPLPNSGQSAVHMMESYGTINALSFLLKLYPKVEDRFIKNSIENSVESLSVRLGYKIIRSNEMLSIDPKPKV